MVVFYEYDRGLVARLLPLIPEFGYWKDIFYLSATLPHLLGMTLQLCAMQLAEDEHRVELGHKPSLMAKYIPKQNKKYKVFANSFAKHLYPEIDCYSLRMAKMRKRISALNKHTGAVEVKMCANEWGSIDPSTVAVGARKKYELAFLNTTKEGVPRSFIEERETCRSRFAEFLNRTRAFKEPIELTTSSDEYLPVRQEVQYWIRQTA